MNITIREATEKDVEVIMALSREFATFQGTLDKFTNTEAQMRNEQPLFNCFLAENEAGEAIGVAIYYLAYYTWVGKSLYLDVLYVQEAYRGQKIGLLLLENVLAIAQKENCQRVRWLVSDWNESAITFYKKYGATVSQKEYVCTCDHQGILAFDRKAEHRR